MCMDVYVQDKLMRQQKIDIERRAERTRLLRGGQPRGARAPLWERVSQWLRQTARPTPTFVPQTKSR